ncbi:MAG: C40 family peptidase [Bacteroidia bacterium]|nr:C40 family peptidase [Bacteroidia bacterium]
MVRRLSVIFLLISLSIVSCKGPSKKSGVTSSAERKKYAALSEKLGIVVDEHSNVKLLEAVVSWLGVPYRDNACTREGTDCSGFVQAVYKEVYGKTISRNTQGMLKEVKKVERNQLKEGDLVFFSIQSKKVSHVGIYLRDNKFVHASTKKGVMVNDLSETYYANTYTMAGRYP